MTSETTWVSATLHALGNLFVVKPFYTSYHGRGWLPKGGYILASNHQSNMDGPLIYCAWDRTLHFLAKEQMFKNPIYAYVSNGLGLIPVARGKGDADALSNAAECLRQGRVVGIFPEGTTSRTEKLLRGHTGVARLHLETGAPIVPMAIVGTREALPRGRHFPRFVKVRLNIGMPIYFSGFMGKENDFLVTRKCTDKVMEAIDGLRKIRSEGGRYKADVAALYGTLGLDA